ncbi:MAG: GNAT family N-acetyltransferase [Candidatus Levybacteria bacterium]|nr:GNAT family N-acetyltransferase [Candidatus Levybacteria bacterium]
MSEKERLHSLITLRKATPRDAHLIACIEETAHPLSEEASQRFDRELIETLLTEYENNGENHSFIAYDGEVPVGHMLMTAKDFTEGKEYCIASWSVIPNYRSFKTAIVMARYALAIGGGCSSYRAWAREKTVMKNTLKPGISKWLSRLGYEAHVDESSRGDWGGEPHVGVRLTPIPSS